MLKKRFFLAGLCLTLAITFFSCAAAPEVKETQPFDRPVPGVPAEAPSVVITETSPQAPGIVAGIPGETPVEIPPISAEETLPPVISADAVPEISTEPGNLHAARPPVRPWRPAVPEYIMGKGLIHPEDMSAFLLRTNPAIEKEFVETLASIYTEETAIEGVNHDVAFAQMCLETGFLRYGGLVTPDMNNFCGLGAIGPGQTGAWFPDPRTGVRAHIQHLKAYATEEPLKGELVDPRYKWVRKGSSPGIEGLSGTWAADKSYSNKIAVILQRLYDFSF